jgi:hypothetical protein
VLRVGRQPLGQRPPEQRGIGLQGPPVLGAGRDDAEAGVGPQHQEQARHRVEQPLDLRDVPHEPHPP